MEKRHINRKRHLAAAVAAMTLAGLNYNANASLTYELTADGSTPGNGKSIAVSSLTPITLDVWATVTGTDGSSTNDALQSIDLSFTSTGGTLGNITSTGPMVPFTALGSHTGAQLGSTPGDYDLGSTDVTDATGWWIGRSGSPTAGTVANAQFLVGKITFTPTTLTAGATTIQATLRNYPDANNGVLWFEDGTTTAGTGTSPPVIWTNDKNTSTGTVVQGTAVTLNVTGGGPITSEWIHTSDSNWNASGNWSGGIPSAAGDTANFLATGDASGTRTVTLDANETVGAVTFAPAGTGYVINTTTGKTLTLNTVSGSAAITNTSGNNTISAPIALAQNATVTVNGGSLTVGSVSGSSKSFTKSGSGNLTVSPSVGNSGLTVGALGVTAGKLVLTGTSAQKASTASTVAITTGAGAKLDISGPGMILTGETVSHVTGLIVAGGGGTGAGAQTWDQPGIGSAFAAADPFFRAVGIVDNDNFILGPTSTFDGVSVPAGSILVKATYAGDINLDGTIDDTDATIFGIEYDGGATSGHVWGEGDLNYDGVIDDSDAAVFGLNFGATVSGQPFQGGVAAVPEPASIGLVSVLACGLLSRRRRSR